MSTERQRALITGASSGIGKHVALSLARRGYALLLVCRSRERATAAREEIRSAVPDAPVELFIADLSNREEVEKAAGEILSSTTDLHLLINNAGAVHGEKEMTADGIERTFALNHLAPFRLTLSLEQLLRRSAPARIVNVTSETYRYVSFPGAAVANPARYSPVRAYAESKLANILFSRSLAERLRGSGVTVAAVHPGGVRTKIYQTTTLNSLYYRLFGWTMLRPEEGAAHVLHAALAPLSDKDSGSYFYRSEQRQPAPHAINPETMRELWALSASLASAKEPLPHRHEHPAL